MAFSQHLKHFKEGKDEILNTKFKPGHQQETTPTAGDNFFFLSNEIQLPKAALEGLGKTRKTTRTTTKM